jgi:hypothetical protein
MMEGANPSETLVSLLTKLHHFISRRTVSLSYFTVTWGLFFNPSPYEAVKGNLLDHTISSCPREADENFALLDYYATKVGNYLPAFRDNLSVPSSMVKDS